MTYSKLASAMYFSFRNIEQHIIILFCSVCKSVKDVILDEKYSCPTFDSTP